MPLYTVGEFFDVLITHVEIPNVVSEYKVVYYVNIKGD